MQWCAHLHGWILLACIQHMHTHIHTGTRRLGCWRIPQISIVTSYLSLGWALERTGKNFKMWNLTGFLKSVEISIAPVTPLAFLVRRFFWSSNPGLIYFLSAPILDYTLTHVIPSWKSIMWGLMPESSSSRVQSQKGGVKSGRTDGIWEWIYMAATLLGGKLYLLYSLITQWIKCEKRDMWVGEWFVIRNWGS